MCKNKKELANRIAVTLWSEDVLDPNNYGLYEVHIADIRDIIERELDGYILVKGEVIE